MDFDPSLVSAAATPFWLCWHDGRRRRRHAADYFARRSDGPVSWAKSGPMMRSRNETRRSSRSPSAKTEGRRTLTGLSPPPRPRAASGVVGGLRSRGHSGERAPRALTARWRLGGGLVQGQDTTTGAGYDATSDRRRCPHRSPSVRPRRGRFRGGVGGGSAHGRRGARLPAWPSSRPSDGWRGCCWSSGRRGTRLEVGDLPFHGMCGEVPEPAVAGVLGLGPLCGRP